MISIIVLTYNSPWHKVFLTLMSILKQEKESKSLITEIIISDDSSLNDNYDSIKSFFNNAGYDKFIFNKNSENLGTVKNVLAATRLATGKYIKAIGAGDLLFNEETLLNVCRFMDKNDSKMLFGKMMAYKSSDDFIPIPDFYAPRNISPYTSCNDKRINKNILLGSDWISGATMFFERGYLLSQLERIHPYVTYCEDLIQCLVVLDGEVITFVNEIVIWYEIGEGISTSSNHALNARLIEDHERFFNYLNHNYPNNKYINIKKTIKALNDDLPLLSIGKFFGKLIKLIVVRNWFFRRNTYHSTVPIGFLNSNEKYKFMLNKGDELV